MSPFDIALQAANIANLVNTSPEDLRDKISELAQLIHELAREVDENRNICDKRAISCGASGES